VPDHHSRTLSRTISQEPCEEMFFKKRVALDPPTILLLQCPVVKTSLESTVQDPTSCSLRLLHFIHHPYNGLSKVFVFARCRQFSAPVAIPATHHRSVCVRACVCVSLCLCMRSPCFLGGIGMWEIISVVTWRRIGTISVDRGGEWAFSCVRICLSLMDSVKEEPGKFHRLSVSLG
jgi:hypothetical protein